MENIITIDLEDWHSLMRGKLTGFFPPPSKNLLRQVDRLLNILDQHQTKATFFVLGILAESHPGLVKQIASQGHEIASHGYSHLPIFKISPEEFRENVKRSKLLLEDISGNLVTGYRAAEFSIIKKTLWALETLAELGFGYDSSIFPMYHRRYGIHDFPPDITNYELPNKLKIVEIPLSTFSLGKLKWSFAGGGYLRLSPLGIIYRIIKKQNERNIPVIIYFHPYEFDSCYLNILDDFQPRRLREWQWCLRGNCLQNLGRETIPRKLSALLNKYKFMTCREYLTKRKIKEGSLIKFINIR